MSSQAKIFQADWLKLRGAEARAAYLREKLGDVDPVALVVDDDPAFAESFAETLLELGLKPVTALKGHEGLELARRHRAQLVLIACDCRMPVLNGFEWRKRALEICPEIPFVLFSGFVDREMEVEAFSLKVARVLGKPIDAEALVGVLQSESDLRASQIRDERELLRSFLDDAESILEQLEEILLGLESDPKDRDALNRAYGLFHTLKGNSGFFEPRTLHEFTHGFEDRIKAAQNGSAALSAPKAAAWLKGLDTLKTLVAEFRQNEHGAHSVPDLLAALDEEGEAHAAPTAAADDGPQKPKATKANEIKVGMKTLDEFMQVSGEMTVIRNMINKAALSLERRYGSDRDVQVLTEMLSEMHKVNAEVQARINDLRRVPLTGLLRSITRTVRETARALGKDVDFRVDGQNLRVDNTIAEYLSHSLIHLVRNSLDHGLEDAAGRREASKPEKGTLSLRLSESGEVVEVRISDDGRGLNVARIRQKAIERGLGSAADLNARSDEEIYPLIFESGFSTAQVTTEFSGRGVGMSVVRDGAIALGGSLQILSRAGRGADFVIRVPVPKSAQIEPCLFVDLPERRYAVRQEKILRVLAADASLDVVRLQERDYLRLEGAVLPIVELPGSGSRADEPYLVVLRSESGDYALRARRIYDSEDTVIKPLALSALRDVGLFEGGTFLPDGGIGLVLSVDGLARHYDVRARNAGARQAEAPPANARAARRFVTFQLRDDAVYALKEEELVRIEECEASRLVASAGWRILPYRGSLLPIVDVSGYLESGAIRSHRPASESELCTILVVELRGKLVGLAIKRLLDLEESDHALVATEEESRRYAGHLRIGARSAAVLDLDRLDENLARESAAGRGLRPSTATSETPSTLRAA